MINYKSFFSRPYKSKKVLLLQALILTLPTFAFARNCPEGQHWVNPHFRSSYTRYDGTLVRSTQVKGHCKVNPRGYKKWHQRLSNTRPKIWGYKKEKTKKWAEQETDRVHKAISIFPQLLQDLKDIKIYRMTESVTKENPATSNYNDIVLYDLAFQHTVPLEQILAHELAHALYYSLDQSDLEKFAISADWELSQNKPNLWVPKKERIFIEKDSQLSLDEDFANHIEHYLFKNKSLKNNSPNSYQWIHKTFGKEFKIQEEK